MIAMTVTGGIICAIGGLMPAFGMGWIGAKAVEAIGRNPEASGKIMVAMLLALAFAESIVIYSFILALSK